MPWGRIDDTLYDHPKVDDLGRYRLPCMGLYLLALSYSNRHLTDGHIPTGQVKRLGGTRFLAEQLVRVGLWDLLVDGYRIHDFLDYNDSASAVRRRRVDFQELGKRGGIASGEARRLKRDGVLFGSATVEPPSRTRPFNPPTPLVEKSKKSDA